MGLNFTYPVKVQSNNEGGFIATFPDVPEANTEAWSMEQLKTNAQDALITSIDFYIEDHRHFPSPSKVKNGNMAIELPASIATKIVLLNLMVSLNIRPVDLARKMKIKPQEVNRIIDVHHATKIDTIQKAIKVLGKELVFALK